MAKTGFYPTPENEAYLAAEADGKPTRFLNAVLDEHRAGRALAARLQTEQETSLDLLRQAVTALQNLHVVFLELVSEVARMGERQ